MKVLRHINYHSGERGGRTLVTGFTVSRGLANQHIAALSSLQKIVVAGGFEPTKYRLEGGQFSN